MGGLVGDLGGHPPSPVREAGFQSDLDHSLTLILGHHPTPWPPRPHPSKGEGGCPRPAWGGGSGGTVPARGLGLGAAAPAGWLGRRAPAHSAGPPVTRARREEGRGEGGADNGPGRWVAVATAVPGAGAGRPAAAGGALLPWAPGGVQPLSAFMLVAPPSVRADEVSPSPAGPGVGAGPRGGGARCGRARHHLPGLRAGSTPGLEGTRVLPPFWAGIRNGFPRGRHTVCGPRCAHLACARAAVGRAWSWPVRG